MQLQYIPKLEMVKYICRRYTGEAMGNAGKILMEPTHHLNLGIQSLMHSIVIWSSIAELVKARTWRA
jgi:hypothetical protein